MIAEYFDKEIRKEKKKELLEKKQPWESYKKIRKGEAISIEDFTERVEAISKINIKFAAFCALLYLTGCRIQEVLPYKYDGEYPEEKAEKHILTRPAMLTTDIKYIEDEKRKGVHWLRITSRCEKKKDESEASRESVIFYDETYPDDKNEKNKLKPLINILESYLDQTFKQGEEAPIFTFSYSYAHEFISKWMKLTPHAIRGLRAQHLLRYHSFDIPSLQKYFNWKDATVAAEYAKSDMHDIEERLLGRRK